MQLHRYWLVFEVSDLDSHPVGTHLGCGITAHSLDDALILAREEVWRGKILPQLSQAVEDVDVSALDSGHVLPNMGDVTRRGVWYPLGYS